MTADTSFWSYVLDAGFVVKCVMLILLFASVASWTIIVERWRFFRKLWQNTHRFQDRFWSGIALNDLYHEVEKQDENDMGLSNVFAAGFQTFSKLQSNDSNADHALEGAERSMLGAENDIQDKMERPLTTLMTIGSMSPYVGLFGTVWGIMTAFQALGSVQQASIAMVAPGISEALITTALGLFAAIPAAIAHNRFTHQVARMQSRIDQFSAELINIFQRATK